MCSGLSLIVQWIDDDDDEEYVPAVLVLSLRRLLCHAIQDIPGAKIGRRTVRVRVFGVLLVRVDQVWDGFDSQSISRPSHHISSHR